jgi:Protein of unknown function (DUF4199)
MKTEVKYGVLFAAIVVVYVMIEHLLGVNTTRHDIGQYTRLAGVIVPILAVFFGIKAKRDKELNGVMTFGQGVKTGFLIAVIQTTLTTIWFWFYSTVINPEYLDTMLAFERSQMLASGTPEGVIAADAESKRAFFSRPVFPDFPVAIGDCVWCCYCAGSFVLPQNQEN